MNNDNRNPAPLRGHNTYKEENWTVVDVDRVDKVFATSPVDSPLNENDDGVRIDLDGKFARSVMRDVGKAGDNANLSIWLTPERARKLMGQLEKAIPE